MLLAALITIISGAMTIIYHTQQLVVWSWRHRERVYSLTMSIRDSLRWTSWMLDEVLRSSTLHDYCGEPPGLQASSTTEADNQERMYVPDIGLVPRTNFVCESRTRTSASTGRIMRQIRNRLVEQYGDRCTVCDNDGKAECAHIVPLSRGGTNTLRNMVLLCSRCHRALDTSTA